MYTSCFFLHTSLYINTFEITKKTKNKTTKNNDQKNMNDP